jgi:sugar phosphate isomerase/epimerase
MKFGINTFLWTAHFGPADFGLLPRIKANGLDGIEATLIWSGDCPAAAIRHALQENELRCTICSVLPATRTGFRKPLRGLCIEPLNRFETFFLNTTADAVALCEAVGHPRVGILWDTFHANIEEKNLGEMVKLGGVHIKHVHTCENDRGVPGTGHVDWPGVFQALVSIGYDGWLTIESFGFALGDLAAAALFGGTWRPIPSKLPGRVLRFSGRKPHRPARSPERCERGRRS